jgi:Tfp pilus assembly protein PilO
MAMTRKFGYGMFGVAILLLVLAAGGFYLLNGRIQAVSKTEADKRAQVGSAKQITSRYVATLDQFNATKNQLRFLEVPQALNMYVPTMLPQIQKLAQSYGCQIKAFTPGPVAAPDTKSATSGASTGTATGDATGPQLAYQVMPLKLDMVGTYSQIMHFVYDLTQFPKIITVESISLHPGAANTAVGAKTATKVEASLSLQSYVFPDAAESAAAAASAPDGASKPISPAVAASSDPAAQAINRPIAAALSVQSQSQKREDSAGLQSQPTTPTLPTNKNLGK